MNYNKIVFVFSFFTFIFFLPSFAERGIIKLHIEDKDHKPVKGLVISAVDIRSTSTQTNDFGNATLPVPSSVSAGARLGVALVSASGISWFILSPYDLEINVPPFEDAPGNYSAIYVAKKGDRTLLQDDMGVKSITQSLITLIEKQKLGDPGQKNGSQDDMRRKILNDQAASYGLTAVEIDDAIKSWENRTDDPYSIGLAALYERNYSKATEQLKLAAQKTNQKQVDILTSLAQSLYHQGNFEEAARTYVKILSLSPEDSQILFDMSNVFSIMGKEKESESSAKQGFEIE
jgi:hypothetical protein